jgi:hypothetical protein
LGAAAAAVLQDLMVVAVALAKLRYYDAELMQAAASNFHAAVHPAQALPNLNIEAAAEGATEAEIAFQPAAGANPQQQRQQRQGNKGKQRQSNKHHSSVAKASPESTADAALAGINQQLLINYIWSNASLAHSNVQLLSAALQALLSQHQGSEASLNPGSVLQGLNPRLAPLCSWCLATLLVCLLADLHSTSDSTSSTATRQQQQEPGTTGSSSSDSSGGKAVVAVEQADLCHLVHAVAAAHQALECKAAAAAVTACRQGTSSASSSSSSSSTNDFAAVRFDAEGLAQMHHAQLLIAAAMNAVCTAANTAPPADMTSTISEDQTAHHLSSTVAAAAAAAEQCSAEELAAFQQQCRAAWQQSRGSRKVTSYLQQQVAKVRNPGFGLSSSQPCTVP